jgi:hypothetical protein
MPTFLYERNETQAPDDVPTPCPCCHTLVATRRGHGTLRYPHACPHGRPCAAGDPLHGRHVADRGTCPECNAARLAERLAR